MSIKLRLTQLSEWMEERSSIISLATKLKNHEIPGGSRWAYVFGNSLIFIFLSQFITGLLLLLYYVPTADYAHISVAYIQKEVTCGNLIRGIHHYGSSAMVIFVILHLLQTFLWGAYKQKRELVWLVGLILLLVVLGFAFTGYLLPWDQKAYFGTNVGVSIMSGLPVVGHTLERIVLGGNNLSTLTLSRFFVVHVIVLPSIIVLAIGVHLLLFWRAHPAGPFKPTTQTGRFYPEQFFKNAVMVLLIFSTLAMLSHWLPAPLEPEANPADASYIARPEWYFLPLFQLLKIFPGNWGLIPTVILPGIVFTLLFLLPFFDRKAERHPFKRPLATASITIALISILVLLSLAISEDHHNPVIKAQLERQQTEGQRFLATPFTPKIVGSRPLPLSTEVSAPKIYSAKCAACHGDAAAGGVGPSLHNLAKKEHRSHDDLVKLLKNPLSYGVNPPMPAFPDLSDPEAAEIADWLLSLK